MYKYNNMVEEMRNELVHFFISNRIYILHSDIDNCANICYIGFIL